ncbi:hypothetical protein [Parasulfitobacter algicola]|uniref:hypothetical protein n=1 Tax=Parasulfitobacter algicola TaxID=2614809 RepID=UPI001FEB53F7|nr:hypothetical protein [Sulfitobacter algicola]
MPWFGVVVSDRGRSNRQRSGSRIPHILGPAISGDGRDVIWITVLTFVLDWLLKTLSRKVFPWAVAVQ